MTSYRQTIKKHKLVLSVPIIVVVILALWMTAGTPKAYEASASLWVDNLPPAPSSLTINDPSIRQPAEIQQLLITQLLQTRDFRLKVGRNGPLAAHLQSAPSQGWGPMALLGAFSGAKPLDAQIAERLAPENFLSTVAGPQVLQISYQADDPEVAAGTLKSLLTEISRTQNEFTRERAQATVAYNQTQVDAATRALSSARSKLNEYKKVSPGADSSDAQYVALQRTVRTATRDLAALTTQLNQSSVSSTTDATNPATLMSQAGFRVIDAPKAPAGAVAGKKQLVMALVGGIFAGTLLSILALLALTPSKPGEPHLQAVVGRVGHPDSSADWEREGHQPQAAAASLHRVPRAPRPGSWDA